MEENKKEYIDNNKKHPLLGWIGQHSDAVMVIGSIIGAVLWINSQFNDMKGQFNELKTDIAVIKTVLIMKF